jgi:hypothetical protein
MNKAIQILMGEHRVIENVLGALQRHAALVAGGVAVERPTVARFATFFRDFADQRTRKGGTSSSGRWRRAAFPPRAAPSP